MKNKTPLFLLGMIVLLLAAFSKPDGSADHTPAQHNTDTVARSPDIPSEFIKRASNGEIILHGYYERNAQGTCTRYTVYDGTGELLYTMIPYATPEGRYLRTDQFDANGQLEKVAVMIGDKVVELSTEGDVLGHQHGNPEQAPEVTLSDGPQKINP